MNAAASSVPVAFCRSSVRRIGTLARTARSSSSSSSCIPISIRTATGVGSTSSTTAGSLVARQQRRVLQLQLQLPHNVHTPRSTSTRSFSVAVTSTSTTATTGNGNGGTRKRRRPSWTTTGLGSNYRYLSTVSDTPSSLKTGTTIGIDECETESESERVVLPHSQQQQQQQQQQQKQQNLPGSCNYDDGDNDEVPSFAAVDYPPPWLNELRQKVASNTPMEPQKVYRYLKLETFRQDELEDRFHKIAGTAAAATATATAPSGGDTTTTTTTTTEHDTDTDGGDKPPPVFDPEALRSYMSQTIRRTEREEPGTSSGSSGGSGGADNLHSARIESLRSEYIAAETKQLWNFLVQQQQQSLPSLSSSSSSSSSSTSPGTTTTTTNTAALLSMPDFCDRLRTSATSIDRQQLWPLTMSMVMIGLSVGVTTPAFPFVVQNLGLSTGDYGMVVSAFGLTKLLGNIPFAVLVERNGRKPYLVYTLIAIATGVGGIGLASGFEELYTCRLITGLGVAGLSCAATMTVTDISTPLNRASSFAPISAGFAAGTAMGPALGGILIDKIGVNPTFYLVGASFLMLGGVNSFLLDETMRRPAKRFPWQQQQQQQQEEHGSLRSETKTATDPNHQNPNKDTIVSSDAKANAKTNASGAEDEDDGSITNAFRNALGQWVPLLSKAPVRNVCIMNAFYWVALAGNQMTLLPLILTDPHGLAMTATQVGQVYMGMSFVQVLGNPLFARVVDGVGTVPGIVGGCTLISSAMFALPLCDPNHLEQMAGVLGVWAAGSSLLSTAPIAHISDRVDDAKRAQAIALLRTSGDVGFLVGASTMGLLSDWAGGLDTAMQSSSAILATATFWYVVRNVLTATTQAAASEQK